MPIDASADCFHFRRVWTPDAALPLSVLIDDFVHLGRILSENLQRIAVLACGPSFDSTSDLFRQRLVGMVTSTGNDDGLEHLKCVTLFARFI